MMSEFDKYIRQSEPGSKEKAQAWQTAIGLQDVDGLKPSEYLLQTAGRHIEGDITIDEVKHLIDTYYKSKTERKDLENERTEEADKVSARITEILSEKSFSFSPDEGNTRTTAVFTMKYLNTFGFTLDNNTFKQNSWYFRNALVRANYNNYTNELHNRSLHIAASQNDNSDISKSQ